MVKTDDTTKKTTDKAEKKPVVKAAHKAEPKTHATKEHADKDHVTKEPVAKKAVAKKVAAHKAEPKAHATKKGEGAEDAKPVATATAAVTIETLPEVEAIKFTKPTISDGRYIFATGRRKTSVANIRLFAGKGHSLVNKKEINKYFEHQIFQDEIAQPFQLTGFGNDFYFTASVNGGGIHSQSQAMRHALAQALASMNDEIRAVLKKNGLLTRDDRKKERKKPGLRRARRSPQWAKR